MLIEQLKNELLVRTAWNMMPQNLPIEYLIFITRELEFFDKGTLDFEENIEIYQFLLSYVNKILNAQNPDNIEKFEKNRKELFPLLVLELDKAIRDELISRLIGHTHNQVSLSEIFSEHFTK
jgi:hypothetical protein